MVHAYFGFTMLGNILGLKYHFVRFPTGTVIVIQELKNLESSVAGRLCPITACFFTLNLMGYGEDVMSYNSMLTHAIPLCCLENTTGVPSVVVKEK
jgi:hypothetical protein